MLGFLESLRTSIVMVGLSLPMREDRRCMSHVKQAERSK